MAETPPTFSLDFSLGGDLPVNRMGFGAMRITGDGIWGPPKDRAEALRVLQRSVELGITFIDTADSYGPNVSEELIAEALYPYPKNLVIGTKGGLLRTGPNQWPINAKPDHLKEALEGSLQRLKLDRIDLYQLHRVDPTVPFEQTLEFLQDAQEEGLIRHIGLSEVTIDQIQQAQKYVEIVSVQNMYSFDNRKWEAELMYCEDNAMAFIPWYPLGGGNLKAQETLAQISEKYGASPHQVALSWLLHRSANILLIPGTSKVKHLEENYQAASIRLSEEDYETLNQAGAQTFTG
ncbi:aldo/keto reductase [Rufibacter glacialis]|uniref:Aldo/keto reductase n=1 Tax=Rufibacter glacialis TaxID=1259555 RepID=A0A5M8QGI6_9BACT|nr:aldo/keto reductase [Rufibacter glacialis]KAA6434338.1 oxidoreductase [Rufibacter glacialis]GGK68666.1 oxidoreductase [Rufibacter glacialis]